MKNKLSLFLSNLIIFTAFSFLFHNVLFFIFKTLNRKLGLEVVVYVHYYVLPAVAVYSVCVSFLYLLINNRNGLKYRTFVIINLILIAIVQATFFPQKAKPLGKLSPDVKVIHVGEAKR